MSFCSKSDNTFVVRVNPNCRAFDFTLFFEDIFFSSLPASIFLLLAIPHILVWRKQTIKLSSHKFAIVKLVGYVLSQYLRKPQLAINQIIR